MLSYNETTCARAIKNIIYVEDNNTNIYAKFQRHPPYDFWEEDFWIFFSKFSLLVGMVTNQNQLFFFDKIHMVGRGLLQEHFCKTFVKISAVTQK